MGVLVGIEEAVEEIRQGRMVILVDDEDRENEGDLTMAAEKVTPEAVNFMTKHGRGLLCLSMTPEKIDLLGLPMMVSDNRVSVRNRLYHFDRGGKGHNHRYFRT